MPFGTVFRTMPSTRSRDEADERSKSPDGFAAYPATDRLWSDGDACHHNWRCVWRGELSAVIVDCNPRFHSGVESALVAACDPNAICRFGFAVFISATERASRQVQRA